MLGAGSGDLFQCGRRTGASGLRLYGGAAQNGGLARPFVWAAALPLQRLVLDPVRLVGVGA